MKFDMRTWNPFSVQVDDKRVHKPEFLYATDSDIAWKWHLTFIGRRQQHNYRLYNLIDQIMKDNLQIKRIVELGTGQGALTLVLGLWGVEKGIPVMTTDILPEFDSPIFKKLGIEFLLGDERDLEFEAKILRWIGSEPVLLFCDGGDKLREFVRFVPKLPLESIVCAHDFETEFFIDYHRSHLCSSEGVKVKDVVAACCVPLYESRWREVNLATVVFKKDKQGVVESHPICYPDFDELVDNEEEV